MNIQWFSLRLTGLISLQSKGLSRVFSNTTVWKHQSSVLSLLYGPTLTSLYDYWTNHSWTVSHNKWLAREGLLSELVFDFHVSDFALPHTLFSRCPAYLPFPQIFQDFSWLTAFVVILSLPGAQCLYSTHQTGSNSHLKEAFSDHHPA